MTTDALHTAAARGTLYRLPDGALVVAVGEGDSEWNGYPVVILDGPTYTALCAHLDAYGDTDPYTAEWVEDGKVTTGRYCDGLQWERVGPDDLDPLDGATLTDY